MFCPQCGAEIASDRVRFCTHCRFPFGSMKEFIVTEAAKNNEAEEGKKFYQLRQRDITLGGGLMLIGAIKAFLITMSTTSMRGEGFGIYLFLLGLLFGAFLLFSQLSPRQRGLTIGATLMFIGSLLAIPAGFATEGAGVLFVAAFSLLIILFCVKIMRAFMRIFFDKEVLPEKKASPHAHPSLNLASASASALQSAQNAADVEPTTNRMKEAEVAVPFSVVENTTETFKNKQSFTQL
ncbi:MAG TPA: zinc ribbon domain-containing protein [Blastocatellia bacterium]|nr:zinc ribbon domain-containing protein [Blastocatellia bacterium]